MSAFKPGDKVLIPATVKEAWPGDELIFVAVGGTLPTGGVPMYVNADAVQPAPGPLYVDPELRPGMVVAAVDPADDRQWWVTGDNGFVGANGEWLIREQLDCARLRIVHPQVTP